MPRLVPVSAGNACGNQGQLEGLHRAREAAAGRLRLDRFGRDAAIVGDLEQSASCQVHGEGGLLQAEAFKSSKLAQLSVHVSALDVSPGAMRR